MGMLELLNNARSVNPNGFTECGCGCGDLVDTYPCSRENFLEQANEAAMLHLLNGGQLGARNRGLLRFGNNYQQAFNWRQ